MIFLYIAFLLIVLLFTIFAGVILFHFKNFAYDPKTIHPVLVTYIIISLFVVVITFSLSLK